MLTTIKASLEKPTTEKPNATIDCPSVISVNEDDNVTCLCKGEGGNPPATVTWYKDGVQVGNSRQEEQLLTLRNINETDNGTYKCIARSHDIADDISVEIIVNPNCKY